MTKKNQTKRKIALSVLRAIFSPADVKKFSKLRGVVLCGLPGCGKSTIADLLEAAYGFEVLSTDKVRTKDLFKGQHHRLASEHMRVMLSRYAVYAKLSVMVNKALNDNKKVVVDGTHLDDKRFSILGGMLSKISSEKMAMVVVRTPEWIIKKRFLNVDKEKYDAWWGVYKYWVDYVKRGKAMFPTKKELSNLEIIKPKRYAIRTFDWVTDIKAIGWDLDGTLYPPDSIPQSVFYGRQIRAVTKANNWTEKKAKREYKKAYEKLGSNTKTMTQLRVDGIEFFKNLWDEIALEKYIKPDIKMSYMFRRLRGFKHFLVTNAGRNDQVKLKLDLIKLSHKWFKPMILAYDLQAPKPDVKGFKVALKKLNLKPNQVLFVGDRITTDIIGAKKAGMRTCLVYGKSKEADVCLKSVYEVAGLFGKEV